MQDTASPHFRLELADSLRFAGLSGDFNPLHVDPVAARRMPFGFTVVHGIHLLLKALEMASGDAFTVSPGVVSVSATFAGPVLTGDDVVLAVMRNGDGLSISGTSKGRKAFTLSVQLDQTPGPTGPSPPESHSYPAAHAVEILPTDQGSPGSCSLVFGREQFGALFPRLSRLSDLGWIGDLLASTRVIGMRYPGLQSVYLSLSLARRQPSGTEPVTSLEYAPGPVDARFGLSRIAVRGAHFEGELEAVFRHRPVDQPPLHTIAARIGGKLFTGHRVLVVGGSRGLGELAAKCAIAGGAEVVITYASGADDARRVCAESRDAGYDCKAVALDVLRDDLKIQLDAAGPGFTHVYYFASPRIFRSSPRRWEPELFGRYLSVYVDSFARLVQALCTGDKSRDLPRFLYPSTSFIDSGEKGFSEYIVAKAAGEMLCQQLSRQLGIGIHHPRLPRMLTDQTSGVSNAEVVEAVDEVFGHIRTLHLDRETA